jgi:hypothetical protein
MITYGALEGGEHIKATSGESTLGAILNYQCWTQIVRNHALQAWQPMHGIPKRCVPVREQVVRLLLDRQDVPQTSQRHEMLVPVQRTTRSGNGQRELAGPFFTAGYGKPPPAHGLPIGPDSTFNN